MQLRPLSQIEQAFTLGNLASALVVVSVFRVQPGPSPDTLRKALDFLQQRHPLLRASIRKKGSQFYFEPLALPSPVPLDVYPQEDADSWKQRAADLLNQPFDHAGPLMRCAYLQAEQRDALAELIYVFHHAIIDGVSGVQLVREVLLLCAGFENKEPDAGTAEPEALQPSLDALMPPAYRSFNLARRTASYLLRQMREDRAYQRDNPPSIRPALHPPSACCILTHSLSETATGALLARTRREKTHVNGVISAAMLLAAHRLLYRNELSPMQTLVFADLRRHTRPRVPAHHLGCYISMLHYTVPIGQKDSVWTLSRRLKTSLYRSGKQGDAFLAARLSKRMMQAMTWKNDRRLANTALSFAGALDLEERLGPIAIHEVHAFITSNRMAPEFSAYGHLFRDRLSLDFMYLEADMDEDRAEALAIETVRLLTE